MFAITNSQFLFHKFRTYFSDQIFDFVAYLSSDISHLLENNQKPFNGMQKHLWNA